MEDEKRGGLCETEIKNRLENIKHMHWKNNSMNKQKGHDTEANPSYSAPTFQGKEKGGGQAQDPKGSLGEHEREERRGARDVRQLRAAGAAPAPRPPCDIV